MSEWTDDDGRPLGRWVEIRRDEWREILNTVHPDSLAVFSVLTDPEGTYGAAQIYTAWGRREDDVPLVDVRDYKAADGRTTTRRIFRKFVPTSPLRRDLELLARALTTPSNQERLQQEDAC